MTSSSSNSKLHIAMFPWFAFGHFIPFLHLSNKLAERCHRVSFLLPKGAQPKVEQLSRYPNLIHFYPLLVPHVDGLPPGAETASDVPLPLQGHLRAALDRTRDQVESILSTLKPDFIFYDFGHWVPALAHQFGTKAVFYAVVSAVTLSLRTVPAKKMGKDMSVEELMELPPGYPSLKVKLKVNEVAQVKMFAEDQGDGLSLFQRVTTSLKESDAIAMRTCREVEGPFCDYLSQQHAKLLLLTGPVLPKTSETIIEEKWANWLCNFEPCSVVYCAFGSQIILQKDQFQELVLGFELCGQPFLVALTPPEGCATIEEGLPEGFEERVKGRGWVYGGWVPQTSILEHPSVGCFVSHCGYGSMWESLLSDCQIVCVPHLPDQIMITRLMVEELKVAVEVEKEENGWISKESLSSVVTSVMKQDSQVAAAVKSNHAKLKEILCSEGLQEKYIESFIQSLQGLLD